MVPEVGFGFIGRLAVDRFFGFEEHVGFCCLVESFMVVLSRSWASIHITNLLQLSLGSTCETVCISFFTITLSIPALFQHSWFFKGPWPWIFVRIYLKPNRRSPKSLLILEFKNNCFIFRGNGGGHGFVWPCLGGALVQFPRRLPEVGVGIFSPTSIIGS